MVKEKAHRLNAESNHKIRCSFGASKANEERVVQYVPKPHRLGSRKPYHNAARMQVDAKSVHAGRKSRVWLAAERPPPPFRGVRETPNCTLRISSAIAPPSRRGSLPLPPSLSLFPLHHLSHLQSCHNDLLVLCRFDAPPLLSVACLCCVGPNVLTGLDRGHSAGSHHLRNTDPATASTNGASRPQWSVTRERLWEREHVELTGYKRCKQPGKVVARSRKLATTWTLFRSPDVDDSTTYGRCKLPFVFMFLLWASTTSHDLFSLLLKTRRADDPLS
jgi:hypothetical protein